MTSPNIALQTKLKRLMGTEVLDVILFGSVVRGKHNPQDTDILVLFKNKVLKDTEYQIRKEAERYFTNVSIISKTEKGLTDDSFDAREGVLFEGTSLLTGETMSERYGYSPFGMYKYNFSTWSKLQKTKFYHALNGRGDKKGVLDMLNCIKISDSLILAPIDKIEEFRDFMDFWKLNYKYIPILLPKRMARKQILEESRRVGKKHGDTP